MSFPIEKTAFCVASFERPRLLYRLLQSIRDVYPETPVYVADDSRPQRRPAPEDVDGWFQLPYDAGLSKKRNTLIEGTTEERLLFLDDDFVLAEAAGVEQLNTLLDVLPSVGIAAGIEQREDGRPAYAARFEVEGKTLHLDAPPLYEWEAGGICYGRVDLAPNYFVARREVFEGVRWDERRRIAEHLPFFLDLQKKTDWEVVCTPEATFEHMREHPDAEYRRHRVRGHQELKKALADRGFEGIGRRL